jgi:hypothetical protein
MPRTGGTGAEHDEFYNKFLKTWNRDARAIYAMLRLLFF